MRATVIGAGVVGLTTALTLAERGAQVTLIERSHELGGNASWLAGGMLAPFCEGESAPASVVALGRGALDWWAARVPGVVREGTLVVAPARDASEIERFAARTSEHVQADEGRIAELEPDLAGRSARGCSSRAKVTSIRASHCRRWPKPCARTAARFALAWTEKRLGNAWRMPSSTAAAGQREPTCRICAACAARWCASARARSGSRAPCAFSILAFRSMSRRAPAASS